MRDHRVLGNDHDTIANVITLVVQILGLAGGGDNHVVANAGILVNDGILNLATGADADAWLAAALMAFDGFEGFIIVTAKDDRAVELRAFAYDGTQTHDGVEDPGAINDAAV